MRKHYRSIFISDCHFGFRHNRSDLLAEFLQKNSCDNLYLVGDIIDIWALQRKFSWSKNDSLAARQILNKYRRGTNIFYIVGNHDGAIRGFLKHIEVEGVTIANELEYVTKRGSRYLVVHGDIFDNNTVVWTFISKIGSYAYDVSIVLNHWVNSVRYKLGLEPWSISLFLKQKVKGIANYVSAYRKHMYEYCREGKYDGIICGHIHEANSLVLGNAGEQLHYLNCGDWVESCTALVETTDGDFEIINWPQEK